MEKKLRMNQINYNKELVVSLKYAELTTLIDGIWQGIRFMDEEIENYHPESNERRSFLEKRIERLKELHERLSLLTGNYLKTLIV